MYAPASGKRASEEIECPFTDLGLLIPDEKGFRFNMSDKNTLPDLIFLAACCDYTSKAQSSKVVSLNKLTYEFNAPGVVFKLSETDVGNRLEQSAHLFRDDLRFVEQFGMRQLSFESDPRDLYLRVLDHYYSGNVETRRPR